MKRLMLGSAALIAAMATSYAADVNAWTSQGNVTDYFSSSAISSQSTPFAWMSEQVTTSNNRWVLPESNPTRAYANGTGVATADAMFASYWVGETAVSSYVNNTPFPSTSLNTSTSTASASTGATNYWGVATGIPSNYAASTNFGSTPSTTTTYAPSTSTTGSTGSTGGTYVNAWGVAITDPYGFNTAPVRRFDAPGVPEPSTYAMIGIGMIGLVLITRKWKKA